MQTDMHTYIHSYLCVCVSAVAAVKISIHQKRLVTIPCRQALILMAAFEHQLVQMLKASNPKVPRALRLSS